MKEYLVKIRRIDTGEIIDEFPVGIYNCGLEEQLLYKFMKDKLHNYSEEYFNLDWSYVEQESNIKIMEYKIYYSVPDDIHRYTMDAKGEKQLVKYLKMLTDEKAYGFEVVHEYI